MDAWRKIRVLTWIASAALCVLLLVVVFAFTILPMINGGPPGTPEAKGIVAAILLQLVTSYFLKKTCCPSCGRAFFSNPMNSYWNAPRKLESFS